MLRNVFVLAALTVLPLPFAFARPSAQVAKRGEPLAGPDLGPGVVETMADVLARESAIANSPSPSAVPIATRPAQPTSFTRPSTSDTVALGGSGTAPSLGVNFQGPWINDVGAGWIPPDPHGAIGPNHFVATVNQHLSVYDRTGTRLLATSLQAFFGVTGPVGDPRVVYDHFSGRFVITGSGFSGTGRIYLAVSSSGDPAGSWFKTFFVAASGSDAGHWPDYPTLGFDANGIYTSAFMVGGPDTMTIFAIDKAPLVAAIQTLGTVTAFRGLPYEDAIQGATTFGAPAGEYMISRASQTDLRIRRVDPPLTAPALVELGLVAVPFNSTPPDAVVQGSIPLWTIDARPLGAIFQNGSLWTVHCIDVGGRAAVRWYQIDPLALATQQVGTIDDATRHYFFPSMAVNANGDVAFGFAGSKSNEFAGAWYAGRKSTDLAGQTSSPALLKAGLASYQVQDGNGFNRWGDYTSTTLDPLDGASFWTIQEYARETDDWGTWIGELSFPGNGTAVAYCFGDGTGATCPCANPGATGHGCANAAFASGALLAASGGASVSADTVVLSASSMSGASSLYFQGTSQGAVPFGYGINCLSGTLVRIGLKGVAGGSSMNPSGVDSPISVKGGVPLSGGTRHYQTVYRQVIPVCVPAPASLTNRTNGLTIVWTP